MSRINSATGKYAILFLGCVLFHVIGTWSLPLIDRDEPRFAEASREMIARGDYVVPHFNNQLRLDKPPLAYWMQIASYRTFGQNDFAARFPSAVAAALIALSILAWGARIGGNGVGLRAAIIFTLSLQTFVHGKAAVADMWLVLFMTFASWAGYELLQRPTSNIQHPTSKSETTRWWLLFYLSLAFGFLAKGPIAWIPVLTVCAAKFFHRDVELARRFKFGRGIVIMLATVALWGVPALLQTHGAFFSIGIGRHVVGRSFGAMEGHGWNSVGGYFLLLPFYFVTIFVSFFPWSFKLPAFIRTLFGRNRVAASDSGPRAAIDNYLIAGVAIVFVIFTLVKTKLPHYTLPAFPLLSLLLARHWPSEKQFKRIVMGTGFLWIVTALIVPPLIARSFPAYSLFRESRGYLRPEMEFGAVNYQEPSLVWYFRSRINGWMTPLKQPAAASFMEKAGPRFIVLPTADVATTFPNPPATWKIFSTNGLNIAKGKQVDLTLVLKPD